MSPNPEEPKPAPAPLVAVAPAAVAAAVAAPAVAVQPAGAAPAVAPAVAVATPGAGVATTTTEGAGSKRPAETAALAVAGTPSSAVPPSTANKRKPPSELQKQIQQQLQQQLQEQLEAAAKRGQQANISPEQIQQQAAAMVQAAAQAQAVVAAAKSRGDGLQPMTLQQIKALSQIQAAAIVNARKLSTDQAVIQSQITLQAQALVHAHQQAQIQAGIYKGDTSAADASKHDDGKSTSTGMRTTMTKTATGTSAIPTTTTTTTIQLTPAQLQHLNELKGELALEKQTATPAQLPALEQQQRARLTVFYEQCRRANADASSNSNNNSNSTALTTTITTGMMLLSDQDGAGGASQDSNSPAFQAQLQAALQDFWSASLQQVCALRNQTEQDFKTHNDLPLARIKRIMKSDEDVRMISAEAPVLLAKACELFILDLSIRAFNYSQLHKRRTLQKEDVKEAIQKTDVFDFLVDVIL